MTMNEILTQVATGKLAPEIAQKQIDAMATAANEKALYCKVSPSGGMSVYGLQRMPVTLYVEQWRRLLGFGDRIEAFLKEHDAVLLRKDDDEKVKAKKSKAWPARKEFTPAAAK